MAYPFFLDDAMRSSFSEKDGLEVDSVFTGALVALGFFSSRLLRF
jgi:hypothetical protein